MGAKVTFDDVMATNPARLVLQFSLDAAGAEKFDWGVVGQLPVLSAVGCIVQVQAVLSTSRLDDYTLDLPPSRYCQHPALVIAWDASNRQFQWWTHPSIPVDPLLGTLEMVKASLVAGHLAQSAAAKRSPIVRPDGSPFRRGP